MLSTRSNIIGIKNLINVQLSLRNVEKGIRIINPNINASIPPNTVRQIALVPRPSRNHLCPGNTPSKVSVLGAPIKIAGIKSTKLCVIHMLKVNTIALDPNKGLATKSKEILLL